MALHSLRAGIVLALQKQTGQLLELLQGDTQALRIPLGDGRCAYVRALYVRTDQRGAVVRFGIDAPRDVPIVRAELVGPVHYRPGKGTHNGTA